MSLLLGIFVPGHIQTQNQTLIEILKELKHYLTLQTSINLSENEHSFTILSSRKLFSADNSNTNQFVIPKNFSYLFTHFQKIYVENEEDLQFFDVCYECLMIIREYLPSKDEMDAAQGLGGAGMSLEEFIQNFENQKNQEFLRRINSNFKSQISPGESLISAFEVENILYMAEHFYFYKNKITALKFLAQNETISKQVFANIGETSLNFLKQLSLDEDFRGFCQKIVQKVAVAQQILLNQNDSHFSSQRSDVSEEKYLSSSNPVQKNHLYGLVNQSNSKAHFKRQKLSKISKNDKQDTRNRIKERSPLKILSKQNRNLNRHPQNTSQDQLKNLSIKSLLFQLRESQSLKRIAMLIEAASKMKIQDEKYENKVQKQVENICKKFLKESYFDRYQTNQSAHGKQKSQLMMDESFIPTKEQVQQVYKFYESLVKFFSKKEPQIKEPKSQIKNSREKSSKIPNTGEVSGKYKGILDQICQKIEKKYYAQ